MTQELTSPQPVQIRVLEELKKDNRLPSLVAAVESVEKAPEVIRNQVADKFIPTFIQIEKFCAGFRDFVVSDETETGKMFEAGQKAKELKKIKRELTALHEAGKESALREGQTYDAVRRIGFAEIDPAIAHYEAQAEYIERKEAARVEALRSERYNLILPYLTPEICPPPWPDWGTMHKADFENTLAFAIDKARQIEAEGLVCIEKERAEKEELERLRKEQAENDALIAKAQAAQREAERETALAKQAAERAGQEAKQVIANHFKDYGKPVDQILAETNENKTTDREKLRAYGAALLQVQCAPIQDQAMRKVLQDVKILLGKIDKFIEDKTKP